FCQKSGRYPKVSELAEKMEMDTEQILSLMEAMDAMTKLESLDDPDRCQQECSDNYRDVEDKQVNMIQLKGIICHLAEQERQVVILRYFKDMTQQQIATRLGISQVQVSRIEKRVLAFLRKEMEF
ncbi:MAG: sigma-70 family RNA polymerase sigma factor, partial [Anaerovorax sp.]|nr:sigma-70 family RNA polymerase sigma factor [Anaerovorax sp.]